MAITVIVVELLLIAAAWIVGAAMINIIYHMFAWDEYEDPDEWRWAIVWLWPIAAPVAFLTMLWRMTDAATEDTGRWLRTSIGNFRCARGNHSFGLWKRYPMPGDYRRYRVCRFCGLKQIKKGGER